jgi:hypothetical protein
VVFEGVVGSVSRFVGRAENGNVFDADHTEYIKARITTTSGQAPYLHTERRKGCPSNNIGGNGTMTDPSLNEISQRYFLHVQQVRAGHLSPTRALRLLLSDVQEIAHCWYPGEDNHWQRAELKARLRELLWTMMEADPDIWTITTLVHAELQRVQARNDYHHCLRRAGVGVARSTSS